MLNFVKLISRIPRAAALSDNQTRTYINLHAPGLRLEMSGSRTKRWVGLLGCFPPYGVRKCKINRRGLVRAPCTQIPRNVNLIASTLGLAT
jgi:hypothetical protein